MEVYPWGGQCHSPGHLLEMFGHIFVRCSDWGKLLAHSERSPGMLSSQQGVGRYAQASAQTVSGIPIKKHCTSWIGTAVLFGYLSWILTTCFSSMSLVGLWAPSFDSSLRGEEYLAKRNSRACLHVPHSLCREANTENSALGRLTDTCLPRSRQLQKWKLTPGKENDC